MKNILCALIMSVLLSGCWVTGSGKNTGKIIDVTWEGIIFKSCEIDVQYGEQSSRIEMFSSRDKQLCDELNQNTGKSALINYEQHLWSWFTRSTDIIKNVTYK